MDSILFTLLSFILALGILVTVHEYGHFWVARKLGVKVLRFSVGFGRPLITFRGRGGEGEATEYVVAAIPLGGYVKMLDEREGEVPESERHLAFNRQSLAVRSAIVVAGPLANLLFAILAFWLIFVIGDTGTRPLVGSVASDTIAHTAGFQADDELVSVGERPTPTWESAVYALLTESMTGEDLPVAVVDVDGYRQTRLLPGSGMVGLAEDGRLLERLGLSPKRPKLPAVIGELVPGEAADQAGLRAGDLILSIDDHSVSEWNELVTYVRQHPGKQVDMEIQRDSGYHSLTLQVGSRITSGKVQGRIGAAVHIPEDLFEGYRAEIRYGPVDALGQAVGKTWDMSVFMLKILGRMVTGEVSVKNLSGPISIAQTAGKTASYGLVHFLKFLALVSISLGVLNLLPIPVLDGGHLLFFLFEAIKGGPLSEETMVQGQKIGLVILLALMGLAFYVDIARLMG